MFSNDLGMIVYTPRPWHPGVFSARLRFPHSCAWRLFLRALSAGVLLTRLLGRPTHTHYSSPTSSCPLASDAAERVVAERVVTAGNTDPLPVRRCFSDARVPADIAAAVKVRLSSRRSGAAHGYGPEARSPRRLFSFTLFPAAARRTWLIVACFGLPSPQACH